jgi:hypothetical protein
MLRLNKTRMNYYEQFQRLIDEYNSGAANAEQFFAQLVSFAQSLTEEEQRGIAENLSEEELALFDILTRPNMKLSREEKNQVKRVAQELLDTLKAERLVLDWRKKQQTRASRFWTSCPKPIQQRYTGKSAAWSTNTYMTVIPKRGKAFIPGKLSTEEQRGNPAQMAANPPLARVCEPND